MDDIIESDMNLFDYIVYNGGKEQPYGDPEFGRYILVDLDASRIPEQYVNPHLLMEIKEIDSTVEIARRLGVVWNEAMEIRILTAINSVSVNRCLEQLNSVRESDYESHVEFYDMLLIGALIRELQCEECELLGRLDFTVGGILTDTRYAVRGINNHSYGRMRKGKTDASHVTLSTVNKHMNAWRQGEDISFQGLLCQTLGAFYGSKEASTFAVSQQQFLFIFKDVATGEACIFPSCTETCMLDLLPLTLALCLLKDFPNTYVKPVTNHRKMAGISDQPSTYITPKSEFKVSSESAPKSLAHDVLISSESVSSKQSFLGVDNCTHTDGLAIAMLSKENRIIHNRIIADNCNKFDEASSAYFFS
jgi:hypothetical protein